MVVALKLRKIGNSVGVILPKEALSRLHAGSGDEIILTESPDSGLRVTANKPDFAAQMKIVEKLSRRYRNALKELSK